METNSDQAAGVIVKSDQSGRTRYTPQYKREVLAAFESSSLSAPVFARQCGIKYPTLAAWIGAQKRGDETASRGNTPSFLFAEVAFFRQRTGAGSPTTLRVRGPRIGYRADPFARRPAPPPRLKLTAILTDGIDLRDGLQRPWYELR
jgi:transposase-like protein